jgi:hypothetical protein
MPQLACLQNYGAYLGNRTRCTFSRLAHKSSQRLVHVDPLPYSIMPHCCGEAQPWYVLLPCPDGPNGRTHARTLNACVQVQVPHFLDHPSGGCAAVWPAAWLF